VPRFLRGAGVAGVAVRAGRDDADREQPQLLGVLQRFVRFTQDGDDLGIRHGGHRVLRLRERRARVAPLAQGRDERRDLGESCHTSWSQGPPTFQEVRPPPVRATPALVTARQERT